MALVMITRYIILDVTFNPETEYGRELAWIAPALKDSGLTMTEDLDAGEGEGEYPSRKWAGEIDSDTYDALNRDWSLDEQVPEPNLGMITEYGHLASEAY